MTFCSRQIRAIVLWILLLIGMILHFNYHVSKLFYGIDIVRPGAAGKIPVMAQVLKTVYYHLPILFIVALLYVNKTWFRLTMFIISVLYSFSHILHLLEEFKKPELDLAQVPLLSIVLIMSFLLNETLWDYFKKGTEE